jgi:hypothetical protein
MWDGDEEVVKVEPQPCDDELASCELQADELKAEDREYEEDEEEEDETVAARNQCHICMEQFALEKQYVEHMFAVHGVQRPFRCHDCGKCLSYRSSLYNHRKIHSDKRPWACDWCPAKFIWSNRQVHARVWPRQPEVQSEISRATGARTER